MSRTPYTREIDVAAIANGLDPQLVEAVCVVESGGYTDALRPEPAFFAKYQAPRREWAFALSNPRRYGSSYGLMQVMLLVAIEVGFPMTDPPERLFIPEVGLKYGCRKLAELLAWSKGLGPTTSYDVQLRSALAAYNGGHLKNEPDLEPDRNAVYAQRVMTIYQPRLAS